MKWLSTIQHFVTNSFNCFDFKYTHGLYVGIFIAVEKVFQSSWQIHLVDISFIENYSKYNRNYLTKVDEYVKKYNKKFKDILNLDGANNGKYNDTIFMKNHKINEIIILMLIIIILIFIYTKKK